jgi:hypothetical protein
VSLIEEILPAYHFREVHERTIEAPSPRDPGPSRPDSAA